MNKTIAVKRIICSETIIERTIAFERMYAKGRTPAFSSLERMAFSLITSWILEESAINMVPKTKTMTELRAVGLKVKPAFVVNPSPNPYFDPVA